MLEATVRDFPNVLRNLEKSSMAYVAARADVRRAEEAVLNAKAGVDAALKTVRGEVLAGRPAQEVSPLPKKGG